jgi:hypothetical protein
VCGIGVYRPQQEAVRQTGVRLRVAQEHTAAGRLRASESLLFQVSADLKSTDRWYTLPPTRSQMAGYRQEAAAAEKTLQEREADVLSVVTGALDRADQGELDGASAILQAALARYDGKEPTILTVSQLVGHFAAGDFDAAARLAQGGLPDYPDTGSPRIENARLLTSVYAQQARYRQAVRAAVDNVAARAGEGDFGAARAAIENEASTLPQPEPVLNSVLGAIDRLGVADFKGAEAALSSLPPRLRDGSETRDLASAMKDAVAQARSANAQRQAEIGAQVRTVAEQGKVTFGAVQPTLRGRAMVWDLTQNQVDQAYELLPDDLRASSREGNLTMFVIRRRWNVQIGTYTISRQPAFQEHMEIAVVYWPNKVLAGVVELLGGQPPNPRPVQYSPGYGSSVEIKQWIERLPRS